MLAQKVLDSIPDLTGKTVVITGATMGLGFHSAGIFVSKGARVLVHGRTLKKATLACEALSVHTTDPLLLVPVHGDLSSLAQTRQLAQTIIKHAPKIDILMLNAGIAGVDYVRTEDGIESCMQINYLAQYYLFKKLEAKLKASKTRIVCVSSGSASASHRDGIPDTLKGWNDKEAFAPMLNYGDSKLANVLFTKYIADHYAKTGIVATVVDPGCVSTSLHAKATGAGIYSFFMRNCSWIFASPPEVGVLTQVLAAVSDAVLTGSAWRLVDARWDISELCSGDRAERLWKTSQDILTKKGFT
ncbi:hypothetical protein MT418_003915 [Batrachochytrium dendrobatidis]